MRANIITAILEIKEACGRNGGEEAAAMAALRDTNSTVNVLNLWLIKYLAALISLGSIQESIPFITSENTTLAPTPRRRLGRLVFLTGFIRLCTLSMQQNRFSFRFSRALKSQVRHTGAGSPKPYTPGRQQQRPDSPKPLERSFHLQPCSDLFLHQQGAGAGCLWGEEGKGGSKPSQLRHGGIQARRKGWGVNRGTSSVPDPYSAASHSTH